MTSVTIIVGTILLLHNFFNVAAYVDPVVGPTLTNCTFEVDKCEWRSADTVYDHPMQWILTDDEMAFAAPPKGSWFAAVEMGNVPNLTLNATFRSGQFRMVDIEQLKITFNYFFWIDPREIEGTAKLSLKYQIAAGGQRTRNHILELWNVTTSAGIQWNTQTVYYDPWSEWVVRFFFFAEVFDTNRVKFAIDEFAVEVTKMSPTTTARTNGNL